MTPDSGTTIVVCERCAKEGRTMSPGPPKGWEGTISKAVCPNCQYAEWHPHCTSVRAECGYGERIDIAALAAPEAGQSITIMDHDVPVIVRSFDELHALGVGYCDYIDPSVSWVDDDDWPKQWTCPECGGSEFEGVHRDYQQSGLKGTSFDVDTEVDTEEER